MKFGANSGSLVCSMSRVLGMPARLLVSSSTALLVKPRVRTDGAGRVQTTPSCCHRGPRCCIFSCPRMALAMRVKDALTLYFRRFTGFGVPPVRRMSRNAGTTFDLAFKTETRTFQAGLFLDCSKCYEHVPLAKLEQFALERGFPHYALQVTGGLPPRCGLAVDLLHAFLVGTLRSAGRQVEVRKYVDNMVLVAAGLYFAHYLRGSYRSVPRALTHVNMQVNPSKTVVVCNGTRAKQKPWLHWQVWRAGRLPPVKFTTREVSTVRVWYRRLLAGQVHWPLDDNLWNNAFKPGPFASPGRQWTRNLNGWRANGQWFF
eukprot:3836290-Amphidinium_carterae.1